ncbi:MAG: thiamine phosphate synthase [Deltaproteobacteria bacterium]|nr:thiamine phosphate synthase [Deltaproteobacteria bacterium]
MVNFNLYLITDRHQTKGRPLPFIIEEALKGGIKAVQLREKDLHAKELFKLAVNIRKITKQYSAKLFINDRVDIAMAVEADGVHLGQSSFSPRDVKRVFAKAIIGVSTHSLKEAKKAAEEGADFITLGPICHTPSKASYGEPLGVEIIKKIKVEVKIPVFAVGGIKKENIKDVMVAGADGAALISAIIGAEDVGKAVMEIEKSVRESKNRLKFQSPNF